jgi:AcrR family transcriptional regulator
VYIDTTCLTPERFTTVAQTATILEKVMAMHAGEEPRTSRDRKRLATRRRLMDTWRHMVASGESTTASIAAITKRAKISVGTFYAHFTDREALTEEVAFDSFARLLQGLDGVIWNSEGELAGRALRPGLSLEQRLRGSLEIVFDFAERFPSETMFLMRLAKTETPQGKQFIQIWDDLWKKEIEALLTELAEELETQLPYDARIAATASYGLVVEGLKCWLKNPSEIPRERAMESLVYLTQYGFAGAFGGAGNSVVGSDHRARERRENPAARVRT